MMRQRFRYGYQCPEPLLEALRSSLTAHGDKLNEAIKRRREELDALTMQLHTDNGALQAVAQVIDRLDAYARGGKL
jgi:P2-related tail formation protein